MKSAEDRTLPLFPLETLAVTEPRGPSIRTLRRRLWKASLAWFRNEVGYEEVLAAARQLHEAE